MRLAIKQNLDGGIATINYSVVQRFILFGISKTLEERISG
jgi:hypothetical protein